MKKIIALIITTMAFTSTANAASVNKAKTLREANKHCYSEGFFDKQQYNNAHGVGGGNQYYRDLAKVYTYITTNNANYAEYESALLSKFCMKVAREMNTNYVNKIEATPVEVAAERKAVLQAAADLKQAKQDIRTKYADLRKELKSKERALNKEIGALAKTRNEAQRSINANKTPKTKVYLHNVVEDGNYAATNLNTNTLFVMVDPFGSYPDEGYYSVHLVENPLGTTFTHTNAKGFKKTLETKLVTLKPDQDHEAWLNGEGNQFMDTIDAMNAQIKELRNQANDIKAQSKQSRNDERDELNALNK